LGSMEAKDIIKHILPKEFVEYFDLVKIEKSSNQLIIHLDEKNVRPPEHTDKELESKGFTTPIYLHDFPIRDQQVLLRARRRKWKDKSTGKTYSRDWEIKHEGTNYTNEFAAFLKKMSGHQTGKRQ
jgi:transposase